MSLSTKSDSFFLQTNSNNNRIWADSRSVALYNDPRRRELQMMGLGKTSLVARRSRAAESMVSTATQVGCATVLYVDRGVIVLNKPPGLESQGTSRSSTKADVKKDDGPGTRPRVISAFDNVLDGTAPFFVAAVRGNFSSANLNAHFLWAVSHSCAPAPCRPPTQV
jgi:hypothetical protein